MSDLQMLKFNEFVWHDTPYIHPQIRREVKRDFFDRREIVERAEIELRNETSSSVVILQGERRSGKTSTMRLIANHLESLPEKPFIIVRLPWQGVNMRAILQEEILQSLYLQLDIEPPGEESLPEPDFGRFLEEFREILARIDQKRVLVCLDEFDAILNDAVEEEKKKILTLLDALAVSEFACPVRLLLTVARIPEGDGSTTHPHLAKSLCLRLRPFGESDLVEMVQSLTAGTLNVSTIEMQRIYAASGGWPYFAKLILVSVPDKMETEDWLGEAIGAGCQNDNLQQTLANIYFKHFDEAEKATLLLLAENGSVPEGLNSTAERLVERDFLQPLAQGGFAYRIGLMLMWLKGWENYSIELERLKGKY
jgi:hypothetical protein